MRKRQLDKGRIAGLYRAGMSVRELAAETGCAELTIKKALRAEGFHIRDGIDEAKILALARAGWQPEAIAWDMHLAAEQVAEVLSRRHRKEEKE
ncbi:MAG: hypothetical protein NC399_02860 [Muribaculum sp.]|nr:hypothetical protein [Muribaculum sp.]